MPLSTYNISRVDSKTQLSSKIHIVQPETVDSGLSLRRRVVAPAISPSISVLPSRVAIDYIQPVELEVESRVFAFEDRADISSNASL